MASANFRIGYSIVGNTGPWTWAAYGACVDVPASAWIKVELESTSGVATINATIPRADEVVMAAGVPTVTIDQVTRTAVFQMPAYASVCCIEVTANPSSKSPVTAALAVHVLTSGSRRLLALDETAEQDPTYKWLSKINAIIRAGASSAAASAVTVDTSAFDKILSAADDTAQKAFNTIDEHTHSSINSEVASVESTVSSEGSTRASQVASVASTVSSEGSTRASADSAVSSESISRNASVAASSLSRDTSLESQASSADVSLTTRLSNEESTRTSQIASVAAAAGGEPDCYNVTRTTAVTLGSSMARVTDMVLTPAAGTYLVIAHARVKLTATDGAGICIAYDGTFVPVTLHTYPNWDSYGCYEHNWCAQCVITCDGAKVVEVHAKYNNSSGPTVEECGLSALKVTAV